MQTINLAELFSLFDEHWTPKVISELNGQYVKIAKCDGEFVWHHHEDEDELFMVIDGRLDIHFRDRIVSLRAGELCVVPRGVVHKPVAPEGTASILLFEPAETRNTGNVVDSRTVSPEELDRL